MEILEITSSAVHFMPETRQLSRGIKSPLIEEGKVHPKRLFRQVHSPRRMPHQLLAEHIESFGVPFLPLSCRGVAMLCQAYTAVKECQ